MWNRHSRNKKEADMEVVEELAEEYKEKLGYFMRKGGDYFLKSGLFTMKAEAKIGTSWYDAK